MAATFQLADGLDNVTEAARASRASTTNDAVGKIMRSGEAVPIVALLKCAKFFVFPSMYEGFGLPVAEALQLGVPVLTSNTSSLPEIAGDAAVLVDPLDVAAMTAAIRTLNADAELRAELARRGPKQAAHFNLEDSRNRLAQAYAKVGVALKIPPANAELTPRTVVQV